MVIIKKRLTIFFMSLFVIAAILRLVGLLPSDYVVAQQYSILGLKSKIRDTEIEVQSYESNLLENVNVKASQKSIQEELESVQRQAPDLKKYEKNFHYPSLLIFFEKEALGRDLDLVIHHDQIRESSHMVEPALEEDMQEIPSQGVSITTIPLSVRGAYEDIRSYISLLEEKDYMGVNTYSIAAEEINKADIEVYVYSVLVGI